MYKSKCKTCSHSDHNQWPCPVVYFTYSEGAPDAPDYCECPEYVPSNNLEYLEWCLDKKQLNVKV